MRFLECSPESFGKLKDRSFTFSEGINVITGPNEAGKSTLFGFLRSMLFGIERGRGRSAKGSAYAKYKPWEAPGAYQGTLSVEIGGKQYLLERNFLQTEGGLIVYDAETGRQVPLAGEFLETVASEVTESGFLNTAMQSQSGAATGQELAGLLQNMITNMSVAKTQAVDVGGALARLTDKQHVLERKKLPEKLSEAEKALEDTVLRQKELERIETERQKRSLRLSEVNALLEQLAKDDAPRVEQEFSKHFERFSRYREDMQKAESMASEISEKRSLLKEWRRSLVPEEVLQKEEDERAKAVEALERAENAWESEKRSAGDLLKREREEKVYTLPWVLLTLLMLGISAYLFIGKWYAFACIPLATALAGTVLYILRRRSVSRMLRAAEERLSKLQNPPSEVRAAEERLAGLPGAEELRSRALRNIELSAKIEQLSVSISEREEAAERSYAELSEEAEALLSFFRQYEPAMEELSEGAIRRIEGSILACSVERNEAERAAREERDYLTGQIARCEQLLETESELWQQREDEMAFMKKLHLEIAADAKEHKALTLAISTIQALTREIHDSFGRRLNVRMSELAGSITNGACDKITADEELHMKVGRRSRLIELEKLSQGTMEQLFLALRIAVGETMYEERMPLVFDDSFVYYDSERLRETLTLLSKLGRQVIICTCSDREERLLTELGITYNKIAI